MHDDEVRQAQRRRLLKAAVWAAAAVPALSAGWLAAGPASAQPAGEAVLHRQLNEATWPAEIVRLADEYLERFPAGPAASEARALRERAQQAAQAIARSDVKLYRSAFEPPHPTPAALRELRSAALGDRDAAWRIARASPHGDSGDDHRYVGWLQFAAMLGSDGASYELALHYRKRGQPALAARYEARAIELGFTPPPALDHVRK